MAMGNIQLVETQTDLDPGPGGGVFFDYRFNQRFSLTVDMWATTHDGTGGSDGDDSIQILGIPNATIKMYFMDDETSKWDPYAGFGVGAYATTEGSRANGTNGVGLGARIDVGFDYHLTEVISIGFAGVFHSAGIINSLDGGTGSSEAIIPFSLIGKLGFRLF
jgi:outer membrane protein W